VDIEGFLRSIDTFDLLVVFGLAIFFFLGYIQGIVRRLLGIASVLFAFFLAAAVYAPLGDFLVTNWTQNPPGYSRMIGFGTIFVGVSVGFTIAIQVFYRPTPLYAKYPIVDEVIGGLLGLLQGLIILGAAIMILDTFYEVPNVPNFAGEFGLFRSIHDAYDPSVTASIYRENLVPGFLTLFGALMPADVHRVFPRAG
jgi:membrane protein required for colicin V production